MIEKLCIPNRKEINGELKTSMHFFNLKFTFTGSKMPFIKRTTNRQACDCLVKLGRHPTLTVTHTLYYITYLHMFIYVILRI